MKKFILLASLLCSSAVFAVAPATLSWSDLELYKDYTLTNDISFSEGVTFKAGEAFTLYDFLVGDDAPVLYYEMHSHNCTDPEKTTEMILVDVPSENQGNVIIGAQLGKGCNLEIFIEAHDYYKMSNFAE